MKIDVTRRDLSEEVTELLATDTNPQRRTLARILWTGVNVIRPSAGVNHFSGRAVASPEYLSLQEQALDQAERDEN